MKTTRPLIGIASFFDEAHALVKKGYTDCITKAGGLVVVIPYSTDKDYVNAIVERLDGILIPGGPDVDPSLYDEEPTPQIGAFNILLDEFYLNVINSAVTQNKPVFGICLGLQILNVYFKGTLIQDIETYRKANSQSSKDDEPLSHLGIKHVQNGLRYTPSHSITIEKDSNIYKLLGNKEKLRVNSLHHQAIKKLGEGLKITSKAPDGIIESVEKIDDPKIFGVQWHPEEATSRGMDEFLPLFQYLVDEASKVCQRR